MNNLLIYKNLYIGVLIVATCLLSACKKDQHFDIVGTSASTVYINSYQQTASVNKFNFNVRHTPIGDFATIAATFPVRSTKALTADLKVTCQIDTSLVKAYNLANGTSYKAIASSMVDIKSNTLTILKGTSVSTDSLKMSISSDKYAQLTAPAYLVPVKISSVSDANVKVSTNLNIVYLIITTGITNCYDNALITDMVGTLISNRTLWTATVSVPLNSGKTSSLFDAKTTTYWYVTPAQPCDLIVDLATSFPKLSGIRTHSYSTSYSTTMINVYSSNDGVTWVQQGSNVLLSTASSYQYIKFYSQISARYLKLSFTGWKSASYVIMAEFDVYTN